MRTQTSAIAGTVALSALACAGGAAAFLLFLHGEELERRLDGARVESTKLQTERDRSKELVAFLAERVGQPASVAPETLRDRVLSDLHRRGVEDDYPRQLERLDQQNEAQKRRAESAEEAVVELRRKAEQARPNLDVRLAALRKELEEKSVEVLAERKRSHEMLQTLEQRVEVVQTKLVESEDRQRQAARDHERELGEANRKVQGLTVALRGIRSREQASESATVAKEAAIGQVVGVDGAAKLVTLNAGREQGVRVGMMIRLFRPDAVGRPGEEVAKLEAVRIDARRCRARIAQNDVKTPILSGDLAFAALLKEKQGEAIGLAGKLDYDGDGIDDGDRIQRFITEQGGVVDFRFDPKGKRRGSITPKLKYLVMDEAGVSANAAAPDRDYTQKLAAIRREAVELGVPILSSRKFLAEMGYRLDLRASAP